jgi:undecaprenol kinase
MTLYVLLAALITRLSGTEWALVLLCIGAVTGAELLNTAVEKLCDRLHPGQDRQIGLVKDMAAGAVLMFAIVSAAVGSVIFFQNDKITRALDFARAHPVLAVLVAATLPLAGYLVFRRYGNDKKNSYDNDRGASKRR